MAESGHHRSLTSILGKSFWAAYLLTGNAARAERAVRQAIDLWDSDEENSEQLLYATVRMAARNSVKGIATSKNFFQPSCAVWRNFRLTSGTALYFECY